MKINILIEIKLIIQMNISYDVYFRIIFYNNLKEFIDRIINKETKYIYKRDNILKYYIGNTQIPYKKNISYYKSRNWVHNLHREYWA